LTFFCFFFIALFFPHVRLCNACGLRYAKQLKAAKVQLSGPSASAGGSQVPQTQSPTPAAEAMGTAEVIEVKME
jgi:hypothetical protein